MKYTVNLDVISEFCNKIGLYDITFYKDPIFKEKIKSNAKEIDLDPDFGKNYIYFSTHRESKQGKTREEIARIKNEDDIHIKHFSISALKCELYGKDQAGNELSVDCSVQWESYLKMSNFWLYKELKEKSLSKTVERLNAKMEKIKGETEQTAKEYQEAVKDLQKLDNECKQRLEYENQQKLNPTQKSQIQGPYKN